MDGARSSEAQQRLHSDFCLVSMPWRVIPQKGKRLSGEDVNTVLFRNEYNTRVSDIESFNWKWSPDGRYGIDLPGGRDLVDQTHNSTMAVFDMHLLRWEHYKIQDFRFEIPRVAFLYWLSCDIICAVTLVEPEDSNSKSNINLVFRQTFFKICHTENSLTFLENIVYKTNKSISVNYWYHIFENRSGEPFYDENHQSWLIFSNGKNSLILIPYTPRRGNSAENIKYIDFNMNQIIGKAINCQVSIDPFFSAHYVPFVYKNEINFLLRIDEQTCKFGTNRYLNIEGVYQLQVDLVKILEREKTSFETDDIKLFRKLNFDSMDQHIHYTQYKNMVTFVRWKREGSNGRNSPTIFPNYLNREIKCVQTSTFGTIDLETDEEKTFNHVIMPNDVVSFHPYGSLLVFRYKEDYAMRMCSLPHYKPLPLSLLAFQTSRNCVNIDHNNLLRRRCGFHITIRRSAQRG